MKLEQRVGRVAITVYVCGILKNRAWLVIHRQWWTRFAQSTIMLRFFSSMTPGSTVNAGGRLASPSEKTLLDHLFCAWLMEAWIAFAFVYALMVDCILGKEPLEKNSISLYALGDRSLIVPQETQ